MKKLFVSMAILISSIAMANAVDITITIPNDKVDRVKEAFLYFEPNPGNYTDLEWFKEVWKRQIIEYVHEYDKMKAIKQAELNTPVDTSIIE